MIAKIYIYTEKKKFPANSTEHPEFAKTNLHGISSSTTPRHLASSTKHPRSFKTKLHAVFCQQHQDVSPKSEKQKSFPPTQREPRVRQNQLAHHLLNNNFKTSRQNPRRGTGPWKSSRPMKNFPLPSRKRKYG